MHARGVQDDLGQARNALLEGSLLSISLQEGLVLLLETLPEILDLQRELGRISQQQLS